ncbi:endonuclease/exonuclease/phosphatase family protein [Verrucomicrobiota bacterium sgz303538]
MFGLILRVLTLAYATLLALLMTALEWWGERNWLLSLLIFAPAWLLLAPLVVLTPISLLLLRWRLLLVQSGCAVFVLFGYMTFRWTPRPPAASGMLTLVTHNIGEGDRQQFTDFLRRQKPDVILLQDAGSRGAEYARRYPGYEMAARGEFVCLSKAPIRESVLLDQPCWNGRALAARFEILFEGKPLALYSVHLPTPRPQFNRLLNRRLLASLLKEDSQDQFSSYKDWIAARVELARALSDRICGEKLPYIAAGDFNMPDHGYIYHLFAREMTDAFVHSGRGWGLTFPGEVSNSVAFLGPWLRIDYIFAGKGWEPLYCEPDTGRKSQHRAVVGCLRPVTSS